MTTTMYRKEEDPDCASLNRKINRIKRSSYVLYTIVSAMFVYLLIWLAVPSGQILQIIDYTYDSENKTFTLSRRVNFPMDVHASFLTIVYGNKQDCSEDGTGLYERLADDGTEKITVTFSASERLLRCLSDPNFTLITQWTVELGPRPFRLYFRPTYRHIPAEKQT